MEEDGIHTLAGIASHGLSKIPHNKVDFNGTHKCPNWTQFVFSSAIIAYMLGKGSEEKNWEKVWSFAKPGGSPGVVKKPYCFFENSIFQRVSGIILGPPKLVLHLV